MRRRRGVSLVLALTAVAGACGSGRSASSTSATAVPAGEAKSSLVRAPAGLDVAKTAAASVDAFGLDLARPELGLAKGNVAVSPWSISTALTMARAGAKGTTASEMDHVLHITDPATIHQAMNGLDQQLTARNATFPGPTKTPLTIELSAANRAFAQRNMHFEQPFLDTLATSYGAGVGLVDYIAATEAARTTINAWVADQTRKRIQELITRGVLTTDTRLVLVNAVYLRADWAAPFPKNQTRNAAFHAPGGDVTVAFMHGSEERGFASGDGWKAVELDYAGGQLAMTVVVPDAGRFDEVAARLDTTLLDAVTTTQPAQVDLTMPKFDIAKALSLKEQLIALGMPTAFSGQADFSAITADEALRIQDVVHQANITVDEQGTVAAAATAVIMGKTSAPVNLQQLTVDRPFLFLLRDKATGALLFAGQVINPAAPKG